MPEAEKPRKSEKQAWGDTRLVLELGHDLKAQLEALSNATGTPMSALGKEAVEAFVRKKGDLREAAVRDLAKKLGIDVDIKKAEAPK